MPPVGSEMDNWPEPWYNSDGHIECTARDCGHRFRTNTDIKYRWNHWQKSTSASKETTTDHRILQALNMQRRCPYCSFTFNNHKLISLRDLFIHEAKAHFSNNTTRIEGIVMLVRQGIFPNATPELQQAVFERMCQIVKTTPEYRVMLAYCNLPPQTTVANLLALLTPEELRLREAGDTTPAWHQPVPAENFLLQLAPNPYDERAAKFDWERNWNILRAAYANGVI